MVLNANGDNVLLKPLYLKGSYGTGKTHFINQLYQWLDELFPGSIRLTRIKDMKASAELVGDKNNEGMLLEIARKQCADNKRGSVVFIEEPSWLNNDAMVNTAKDVINGNQSSISTEYFSEEFHVDIPPMIIVVTANYSITEGPLASRFDTIAFPEPSGKKLEEYTLALAQKSRYLALKGIKVNQADVQEFIHPTESPLLVQLMTVGAESKKGITNFRDADGFVSHMADKIAKQKRTQKKANPEKVLVELFEKKPLLVSDDDSW